MASPAHTKLMRLLDILCLAIFLGAVSFFAVRLLSCRGLTDARRALGAILAVGVLCYPTRMPGKLTQRMACRCVEFWKTLEKIALAHPFCVGLLLFLAWLSTHAIWGLGIQPNYGYDITFFVQAAYNAFHPDGLLLKSIEGRESFLAHHFEPFLFLFHPLAKLREAPFLFYFIQDFAQAAFATFMLIFCKKAELPKGWALLVFAVMVGNPFWNGVIHYEFHEVAFAPILMAFAYWAYTEDRLSLVFLCGIALLSLKEQLAFSVFWGGLILALAPSCQPNKQQRRLLGLGLALLALSVACLYFGWILPTVRNAQSSKFLGYYAHLGRTPLQIALSPLQNPAAFFASLFSLKNLVYVATLCPLALLTLRWSWRALFFIAADLPFVLLASTNNVRDPENQYAGPILFWIFLAFLWGVKGAMREGSPRYQKGLLVASALLALWWPTRNPARSLHSFFTDPKAGWHSRELISALRSLPKDIPVGAQDPAPWPFLSQRDNLFQNRSEISAQEFYLVEKSTDTAQECTEHFRQRSIVISHCEKK